MPDRKKQQPVAEYVTVARDRSTDAKILLDTSVRRPTERAEHTHQLSAHAAQSETRGRKASSFRMAFFQGQGQGMHIHHTLISVSSLVT